MRPGAVRTVLGVLAVAVAVGLVLLVGGGGDGGDGGSDPAARATDTTQADGVRVDDLPVEAQETLRLIDAGGPFPYPGKDGSTFGNFEGLLPEQERGYYREYTVPTPGEDDRGARRLVTGEGGEIYYTDDHYSSFDEVLR